MIMKVDCLYRVYNDDSLANRYHIFSENVLFIDYSTQAGCLSLIRKLNKGSSDGIRKKIFAKH